MAVQLPRGRQGGRAPELCSDLGGLHRESSYLEITPRSTFTFSLEDWCHRLYENRLLDKYSVSDYTSKTEQNGTSLLLGYKSKLDLFHNKGIKDNGL